MRRRQPIDEVGEVIMSTSKFRRMRASSVGAESTCGPLSVANVVEEIGATLVGKDPFRIEEHWQRLYHLYHNVRGGVIQMAAISGIEIALWDIKGKAFDAPVWQLLGGTNARSDLDIRSLRWCNA